MMKKNNKKFYEGFTLIELILYVSIITIVMSALIPFAWNIIGGSVKSTVEQDVSSQARYVSERIKYEIRNASDITSVNPTSISLTNFAPDTTTVISLVGSKMQINKNGTGAVDLNSDDTAISGLTFVDYSSADLKSKNIKFTFTLDDSYTGSRQEYNAPPITIESSAEVRSN